MHKIRKARYTYYSYCFIISLLVIILSGCTHKNTSTVAFEEFCTQPYQPTNVYKVESLPPEIRRIAVLPVYSHAIEPSFSEKLDAIIFAEVNQQILAEAVPISQKVMQKLFQKHAFNSTSFLPNDLFSEIYERYHVDAILFVDITHYNPYRPLSIGIRSKLVEVRNGDILWSFDNIFDSGNPHVAVAARRYQKSHDRSAYPLNTGESVLQSPQRFAKYVAHETFMTLPSR